jgi:hypothetical protein
MKTIILAAIRCFSMFIAVAAVSVAYPAKANLITNPGFETGDFTGWTLGGTPAAIVFGTVAGVSPHSGNFQAIWTDLGLGTFTLSQTLTTPPDATYTIDFWVALLEGFPQTPQNSIAVQWAGATVFSLANQSSFGYTEFTFNVTASTASTNLAFLLTGSPGLTRWFLDDISVNPSGVGVPDGGSTVSLLGCALLGLAAVWRKLSC